MSTTKVDADAFRAFELAGWESAGKPDVYHSSWGKLTQQIVDPLLDSAGVRRGSRTLDLATGPGYAAARARERQAVVTGIDFAAGMVALARRLHPGIEFRQADVERLPFADDSFDAVIGNMILNHLARPEASAKEIARVLAAHGRVALTVWDSPERARFIGVFLDAVGAAGAAVPPGIPTGPPIFRFADDSEFQRLFTDVGLVDGRVQRLEFIQHFASGDELWHGVVKGSVRLAATVLMQPEPIQAAIRREFDRIVASYQTDGGVDLPVSVKLGSARK